MSGKIDQGVSVEIAGRIETAHGSAVAQSNTIELGVHVLDVYRVALVAALRQAIHDGDRMALGPAVGERSRDKNHPRHGSRSKSVFGTTDSGEPTSALAEQRRHRGIGSRQEHSANNQAN